MHTFILSHLQLFGTPKTVDHKAPLSMGFPRKEYWNGLPFPSPNIRFGDVKFGLKYGFPRWLSGKESTCQCRRCGFSSRVGKIP